MSWSVSSRELSQSISPTGMPSHFSTHVGHVRRRVWVVQRRLRKSAIEGWVWIYAVCWAAGRGVRHALQSLGVWLGVAIVVWSIFFGFSLSLLSSAGAGATGTSVVDWEEARFTSDQMSIHFYTDHEVHPVGFIDGTVTVQAGDTLWTIAERHVPHLSSSEAVRVLRQVNSLSPGQVIHPGDTLMIPMMETP